MFKNKHVRITTICLICGTTFMLSFGQDLKISPTEAAKRALEDFYEFAKPTVKYTKADVDLVYGLDLKTLKEEDVIKFEPKYYMVQIHAKNYYRVQDVYEVRKRFGLDVSSFSAELLSSSEEMYSEGVISRVHIDSNTGVTLKFLAHVPALPYWTIVDDTKALEKIDKNVSITDKTPLLVETFPSDYYWLFHSGEEHHFVHTLTGDYLSNDALLEFLKR